jgi:cytoskeletal protein CcmA (bactofilin family)
MATTDRYPFITVAAPATQTPARPLLRPANVTAIGHDIKVTGLLTATEHVIIEGAFEGEIIIPEHGLAISGAAHVRGDVCARAITVVGRVDGNLTASALIELRETAVVTGRLASPHVSMEEGALFQGTIDPTKAAAAFAVARHRLQRPAQAVAQRVTASDAANT